MPENTFDESPGSTPGRAESSRAASVFGELLTLHTPAHLVFEESKEPNFAIEEEIKSSKEESAIQLPWRRSGRSLSKGGTRYLDKMPPYTPASVKEVFFAIQSDGSLNSHDRWMNLMSWLLGLLEQQEGLMEDLANDLSPDVEILLKYSYCQKLLNFSGTSAQRWNSPSE
jgi:hypothetical protein